MIESIMSTPCSLFFFFNDTATTEIYTLSLHDALPIFLHARDVQLHHVLERELGEPVLRPHVVVMRLEPDVRQIEQEAEDRKSTRLNSSHSQISYAVFCLKKKKNTDHLCSHIVAISSPL